MTAEYDGRLIVRVKGKGIEPCCARMHDALYAGVMYRGTVARMPCVSLRLDAKRGIPIERCPFCGAVPEVVE